MSKAGDFANSSLVPLVNSVLSPPRHYRGAHLNDAPGSFIFLILLVHFIGLLARSFWKSNVKARGVDVPRSPGSNRIGEPGGKVCPAPVEISCERATLPVIAESSPDRSLAGL